MRRQRAHPLHGNEGSRHPVLPPHRHHSAFVLGAVGKEKFWSSGSVQAHEIEDVEHRISIALKNNKLLQRQRPDELIKSNVASRPLRMAI